MSDHDLDFDRDRRLGFPEFVFGEAKSVDQLAAILDAHAAREEGCLVTRLQAEKAAALLASYPDAAYDPVARTLRLGAAHASTTAGSVAIVAAGTSDVPVVAEAAAVLDFLGVTVQRHVDKGVAGVHRALALLPDLARADVIICVAGFEGALPSVMTGLVRQPVIGVPTSVGYGVAAGGASALHAMLASCASGLTVVNIDNGFGAAIAAVRILGRKRRD